MTDLLATVIVVDGLLHNSLHHAYTPCTSVICAYAIIIMLHVPDATSPVHEACAVQNGRNSDLQHLQGAVCAQGGRMSPVSEI